MKLPILLLFAFFVSSNFGEAQSQQLIINSNIVLPKDSIESKQLVTSFNHFLDATQGVIEDNEFVLASEKIETLILVDEMYNIQKSGKFEDDYFYKPYLTNVVPVSDGSYLLQVSYIGISENTPFLRATFEFLAIQENNRFLFSSPLLRNTQNWKKAVNGNVVFHYKESINQKNILEYEKYVTLFDGKLNALNKTTEFYCSKDIVELLKLIGVLYKSDYNGMSEGSSSFVLGDEQLVLLGNDNESFSHFDPHDLWHARLNLLIPRRQVNRPVDEACAYLYGGSWGLSWENILDQFMTKIASNKNADWIGYKENPENFGESETEHLMVDYVVNALIVQKLEEEQGFSAVWELLKCGKYEKGNANYFEVLEKLTGITKLNYNEKIWKLINQAS